jgi:hypothetical protein
MQFYNLDKAQAIKKLKEDYNIQDEGTFEKKETVKRSDVFERLKK